MVKISKKASDRFQPNVKKYVKILEDAKSRDLNESDTVRIINDMLSDIFGYDKYTDITSEYEIKGTYCDLAIKDGPNVRYLIECKAIDAPLKEPHLRQAINYAAHEGIKWIVLTNSVDWEIYKIFFEQPIKHELIFSLNFLDENPKDPKFLEKLFLLSKEALSKSAMESYDEEREVINKYIISAILQTEGIIKQVRKELRGLSKGIKIDVDSILEIMRNDVLKRELVESELAKAAIKKVKKALKKKNKSGARGEEKDEPRESFLDDNPKDENTPSNNSEFQ